MSSRINTSCVSSPEIMVDESDGSTATGDPNKGKPEE